MRTWFGVVLALIFFLPSLVNPAELDLFNLGKDGLAIDGYDPVSYHRDGPQKGSTELTAQLGSARFYFASEENRRIFLADPGAFIPAYGGWCAWAMLDGKKVAIDPVSYKVVEGVTYLFYDGFWGDTLMKWNEKAADDGESSLVSQADMQWGKIMGE